MTQGQGTFTLEFSRYKRLPRSIEEDLIAERKKAAMAGALLDGVSSGGEITFNVLRSQAQF